jgi:hypothetical protein
MNKQRETRFLESPPRCSGDLRENGFLGLAQMEVES